jgi:sugar phosphate isomerase/epimerase
MLNRRSFVKRAGAFSIGAMVAPSLSLPSVIKERDKVSVFSKNLQWLHYRELGSVAAEIGFDGVDLTVRPGGHILPQNAEKELADAVKSIRAAGSDVFTIVTAINDAEEKYTEAILRSASALGIRYYRLNWFSYDDSISINKNLDVFSKRLERLESINRRFQIHGAYQNHAGASFGASVWDLYSVLKNFDPTFIGCQFDVRHACVEGFNSWTNDFQLIAPYVRCYNVKDFHWVSDNGKAIAASVPLGSGTIDLKKFFELKNKFSVSGPLSLHFEYPLGGAESGERTISIQADEVKNKMKKDLTYLRPFLS